MSVVYPELNQKHHGIGSWPALPKFIQLVHAQFECYDNINVVLERPDEYQQWGRERTEEEANEIDRMIYSALRGNRYDFVDFKTSCTVVDEILEWLVNHHELEIRNE